MKNLTRFIFVNLFLFFGSNAFSQVNLIEFSTVQNYSPSGTQERSSLAWNTKTGKSVRYYYDSGVWKKSKASLPDNPLGTPSSAVGEIMMNYLQFYSNGVQVRTAFVWNTKTGKSARYYYDKGAWKKSTAGLPDNPLGSPSSSVGEIMMEYIQYGTAERTVYVWNTKTGKSARYYYHNRAWLKSKVAFPDNPVN